MNLGILSTLRTWASTAYSSLTRNAVLVGSGKGIATQGPDLPALSANSQLFSNIVYKRMELSLNGAAFEVGLLALAPSIVTEVKSVTKGIPFANHVGKAIVYLDLNKSQAIIDAVNNKFGFGIRLPTIQEAGEIVKDAYKKDRSKPLKESDIWDFERVRFFWTSSRKGIGYYLCNLTDGTNWGVTANHSSIYTGILIVRKVD